MKADFFSMRVFLYHHLKYLQRKERYERRQEQA